jgi:hypothetical protein
MPQLLYPRLELNPGYESWALIEQIITSPLVVLEDPALVDELEDMLDWGHVGGQTSIEHSKILAAGLVKIAKKHGYPNSPNNDQKRKADTEMAIFLHNQMTISRNEAAHEGVWNAMSCYFCPAVVRWRWLNDRGENEAINEEDEVEKIAISERWFTQSKPERHAFGRLWWRAELLKDNETNNNPYWIISSLMEDEQVQCTERGLFVTHREAIICLVKQHLKEIKPHQPRMQIFRSAIKNLRKLALVLDLDTISKSQEFNSLINKCYSEALACHTHT